MVPQWDFLNFMSTRAAHYPGFTLLLNTEATELVYGIDRVTGVVARGPAGPVRISADLVVAADGRSSAVRTAAGLPVREIGVPIDALWFRIGKLSPEPPPTLAYIASKGMVLTIDRGDYYQAGMYVAKGSFTQIKAEGIERFRTRIVDIAPVLANVVDVIVSWDQVKLLTVQVNNLTRWHRPGLLCIGDAAHAMSPAFGVGINYAVQDAIATANILTPALREHVVTSDHLAAVQRRRERPTRMMQRAQVLLHQRISRPNPGRAVPALIGVTAPIIAPALQRVAARLVGLGLRPERISS
jgi:2-polyprenyl-6-methoxyphenol hydroxylase-like FAD-dependent oxidoreductase